MKRKIDLRILLIVPLLWVACNDDDTASTGTPVVYEETEPATLVGYCRNDYVNVVGTEENSMMGAAVRFDSILAGKGCRIIAVRAGLSSASEGVQGEVHISKRLKSKPLYSQRFVAKGTGWEYVKLDTPYELKDKDTLYIKYTLYGKGQLIGYQETGIKNKNSDMIMLDGQWIHLTSAAITGQVCVQAVIAGADKPSPTYDLSIGTLEYAKYIEKGKENSLSVVVTNYGSHPLSGCILTYKDGNNEEEIDITESLPTGKPVKVVFSFPEASSGERRFTIGVRPPDSSVKETTVDNNMLTGTQNVYGESFERTLLLEQFTGQGCMYCPAGEKNLEEVIGENRSRIAWVAHHVGFGNDAMTIPESSSYIRFYNTDQTYAPAVMINRTFLAWKGIRQPVFSSFDFNEADLTQLLQEPAYVSVKPETDYDPQSRKLKVAVSGVFLIKDVNARLTLFLVQDGIIGYQENGGKEYEHKAVLRACLSDVWGDVLAVGNDGLYEKSYEYTVPEEIGGLPCEADKMYVVAFVADYNPDDVNDCKVYNAAFKSIQ